MSIIKTNKMQLLSGAAVQNVLQVVSSVYQSAFTTYSTNYVNVFGVTITPRMSDSRFYISASVARGGDAWNAGFHYTAIQRGTTLLYRSRCHNYAGSAGDTYNNPWMVPIEAYDTVQNTTSPITYYIAVATPNASYQTNVNTTPSGGSAVYSDSMITVMEIAQ